MFHQPRLFSGILLSLFLVASSAWAVTSQHPRPVYEDNEFIADERHAIERITAHWSKDLSSRDPEKIASLYDNDHFILYATFQNKIETYEGLINYFKKLMAKPELKVVFTEQNIRVFGSTAINSGLYTFSFKENGKMKEIPARYTFVYLLTPLGWRIVEHHSSELPE